MGQHDDIAHLARDLGRQLYAQVVLQDALPDIKQVIGTLPKIGVRHALKHFHKAVKRLIKGIVDGDHLVCGLVYGLVYQIGVVDQEYMRVEYGGLFYPYIVFHAVFDLLELFFCLVNGFFEQHYLLIKLLFADIDSFYGIPGALYRQRMPYCYTV